MVTFRRALLYVALLLVIFVPLPAFALDTPEAVQALSSAGTAVGSPLLDPNGNPYLDAKGQPVTVTSSNTEYGQATATSLANTLKMPVGDLLAQADALGISIPLMMTGKVTTVTRSDGGTEHIFSFTAANGDSYVFLADQTGPNVYGIRIANVHANGMGSVLTAHGLNGNFTSPPWYLSPQAKEQYWMKTVIAQVFVPTPPTPADPGTPLVPHPAVTAQGGQTRIGDQAYVSDYSVGNLPVTLSGAQKRLALEVVRRRTK
ncbi:MAG TPA: hypothetical protein V6D05_15755 [Stenomitos sp.]